MKTLVYHEIFSRNTVWCRQCGSEFAKRSRDTRSRHGYTVPPKKVKSVSVFSELNDPIHVRSANGFTVLYQYDEVNNEVSRTVSICWKLDQFNKKVGVTNCARLMLDGARVDRLAAFNTKFNLFNCNKLFREKYPIIVDSRVV